MSHICRIYQADKVITRKQIVEDPKTLRNVVNYSKDSSDHSHGVEEVCIFNEIPIFHIMKNASLDSMHDIYESICRYEIAKILNRFINVDKLFSLEALNSRIQFIYHARQNVPPKICAPSLKKQLLIMSSSEMAT
ncbi:hypothetical protein PV327_010985 [Microctonus hyperodae]|uniref:Uncharacterized protein n=1 Tax=Microctonus hyperodae TaxID=165561 RepID=A0AA39F0A1_MICHY|nr:hypothetical protein PV327_010985 [Microctonus hyperodae]